MENILFMDGLFVITGLVVGLAIGFIVCKCIHQDNLSWYVERLAYFEKREKELTRALELSNASDVVFDNQGGWKVVPKENEHCAKS
jgi:hypothetical protein